MYMKKINLAIISDLHIGHKARSKDLCPYETDKMDEKYKEKFIQFLSENNISADYLILPGDISDSGQYEEIVLAKEIITTIANELKIKKDKIFSSPGNHDVDWEEIKANYQNTKQISSHRFMKRYNPIKEQFFKSKNIKQLYETPYFGTWEDDNIFLISYNSSFDDRPILNDNSVNIEHYGKINNETITQISDVIKSGENGFLFNLYVFI